MFGRTVVRLAKRRKRSRAPHPSTRSAALAPPPLLQLQPLAQPPPPPPPTPLPPCPPATARPTPPQSSLLASPYAASRYEAGLAYLLTCSPTVLKGMLAGVVAHRQALERQVGALSRQVSQMEMRAATFPGAVEQSILPSVHPPKVPRGKKAKKSDEFDF